MPLHPQVVCGLPVYIKFAGAAVVLLRRWLDAEDIPDDEKAIGDYLDHIHVAKFGERSPLTFDLRKLKVRVHSLVLGVLFLSSNLEL